MLGTLASCSSSDSDDGSPAGGVDLGVLSDYCTGKLLVEQRVMTAIGHSAWGTKGSLKAPAGTEIVVGPSFDKWRGFYYLSVGQVGMLSGDSSTGLVKDTDFTSNCATDVNAIGVRVLLQDSTVYPNPDLSGSACVLPAGTSFKSAFSFAAGTPSAAIIASEIKDACGYETAYSSDFVHAQLLPK